MAIETEIQENRARKGTSNLITLKYQFIYINIQHACFRDEAQKTATPTPLPVIWSSVAKNR